MNTRFPILKYLASLKLAVFIMLGLGILTAVGTFVEAHYNDTQAAGRLVYKTPYMFTLLALLCVNLIAVMIDRWPWKKRHRAFISAHVGILLLIFGSWVTMEFGLDGNLVIPIGDKGRWVRLNDTELTVWATFDGDQYSKVFHQEVDFLVNSPKKRPIEIPIDQGVLKISDYKPYVYSTHRIVGTDSTSTGPAIRFHLYNDRASVNDWLFQESPREPVTMPMGPAEIFLGAPIPEKMLANQMYLQSKGEFLEYAIFYGDGKLARRGKIREAEEIDTGWMGLKFRLLRYYPHAQKIWEFEDAPRMSEQTTSTIYVEWKDQKQWVAMGDRFKIFTDKAAYLLNYSNKVVDLGFDVRLTKFEMGKYQGTNRAATYKSFVEVPDLGAQEISMNQPLKHQGKTLYQASFSSDENGQVAASVLSVNDDPGRWIKYLGSLIISLGVIWLFYDRRKSARAMGPKDGALSD